MTDEERREEWRHEAMDEAPCESCHGRGWLAVEPNSSLKYSCPDCEVADE
jgi:hypothetical protein